MNHPLEAINQTSLGDRAYKRIAGAIIQGHFKSGEKVSIRRLADVFQVSSTPVRDAVKRLILEGALEQRSSREVVLPVIAADKYLEIAAIRKSLEGLAAGRAAELRTPADIERLRVLLTDNEAALDEADYVKAIRQNQKFHFALAEIGRMPVLHGILQTLWLKIGPPIATYYRHGGRGMVEYHYKVLEALEAGDAKAATEWIGKDIADAADKVLAYLERLQAEADEFEGEASALPLAFDR